MDHTSTNDDLELMRRIAQADRTALATLYDRHAGVLLALALRMVDDGAAAEQIVQEVFLTLWEQASLDVAPTCTPLRRLVTMTRERALAWRRERATHAAKASAMTPPRQPSPQSNDAPVTWGAAPSFQQALGTLDSLERQAIEMAFFSGLTQNEISECLQQPPAAVKAGIRRGMLKLRGGLERHL